MQYESFLCQYKHCLDIKCIYFTVTEILSKKQLCYGLAYSAKVKGAESGWNSLRPYQRFQIACLNILLIYITIQMHRSQRQLLNYLLLILNLCGK